MEGLTSIIKAAEDKLRELKVEGQRASGEQKLHKSHKINEQATGEFRNKVNRNNIRIIVVPESQKKISIKKQQSKTSLL